MKKSVEQLSLKLTELSIRLNRIFEEVEDLYLDLEKKKDQLEEKCDPKDEWDYSEVCYMLNGVADCFTDLENAKYCLDTCVTMEDVKEYKALEEKNKN